MKTTKRISTDRITWWRRLSKCVSTGRIAWETSGCNAFLRRPVSIWTNPVLPTLTKVFPTPDRVFTGKKLPNAAEKVLSSSIAAMLHRRRNNPMLASKLVVCSNSTKMDFVQLCGFWAALIKFINAEKEMDEYRVSLSLASTSRAVKWHSGWWASAEARYLR